MIRYVEDARLISAVRDQLVSQVEPELRDGHGRNVLRTSLQILERLQASSLAAERLMAEELSDVGATLRLLLTETSESSGPLTDDFQCLVSSFETSDAPIGDRYELAQKVLNKVIESWSELDSAAATTNREMMHELLARSARRSAQAADPRGAN